MEKFSSIESLGLTEIELSEKNEINGGFVITGSMLLGGLVGAVIGVILTQDLDSLADAASQGYNDAKN